MSRNFVLALGSLLWAAVFVVIAAHVFVGDPVVPAALAIIFVGWLAIRRPRLALRQSA